MADARRLTLALLAIAGVAVAASPCEEDRGQTGLALAPGAGGVTVAAVDDASAAAGAGLRVADEVVQVNAVLARTCADYARAVRDARRDRKALLVLVRRAGAELPVVLGAATWDVAVAAPPSTIPAPAPSVRPLVTAAPAPALPPAAKVTVDEVVRALATITPAGDRPPVTLGVEAYRRQVEQAHAQVAALTGDGATTAVRGGLATVLAYHEAAAAAWAVDDTEGSRTHRPRLLPDREHVVAYYAESDTAGLLERFPFLAETVVREPAPGILGSEAAGIWRPLVARALLWEHARSELALLQGWLAGRRTD